MATRPILCVFTPRYRVESLSVEWLFGDIVNYFIFSDFKKNLKISLCAVGKIYIVAATLRNALTCMYGNSTSEYFALHPSTIHDHFA